MKLQPVTDKSCENYPTQSQTRSKNFKRWVRKLGAAVGVSIAMFSVGCLRTGGVPVGPEAFTCEGSEDRYNLDEGSYYGYFCSSGNAEGDLVVEEQSTFSFSFETTDDGTELQADVHIIDENDQVVGTHESPGDPLVLELAPGNYTLEIVETGENSESWFTLNIEKVTEPEA